MNLPFKVDLSDKTVAITGGGGVLMSEFGKILASCGAKVALLDINDGAAKSAAQEIAREGGAAIGVKCDCLDRTSIEQAKEEIERAFGKVNFLINGAGGNNPRGTTDIEFMTKQVTDKKTFFDLDAQGLRFVFDLNILTAFLTTQVFARDMMEMGGGNIINISSMNAFRPLTKIPAYSAAKAGVSNFTQWLAVHFAPCNIRVNAIAPGFFVTNQNRGLLYSEDGRPTQRTEKILAHTPMGRFGEVCDLEGTLLFLASDEASGFVTGVIIPVDGGFSAYSGV
jgi:NAD(P)-dependent dehydrogenase (short-subunit alcohol dehydrogenase family)